MRAAHSEVLTELHTQLAGAQAATAAAEERAAENAAEAELASGAAAALEEKVQELEAALGAIQLNACRATYTSAQSGNEDGII